MGRRSRENCRSDTLLHRRHISRHTNCGGSHALYYCIWEPRDWVGLGWVWWWVIWALAAGPFRVFNQASIGRCILSITSHWAEVILPNLGAGGGDV
jgi:hypothetical protein